MYTLIYRNMKYVLFVYVLYSTVMTCLFRLKLQSETNGLCVCCRNLSGPDGRNLFMRCVSDLALESRDFDTVLGRISDDGCHIPGLIHSFRDVQVSLHQQRFYCSTYCYPSGQIQRVRKKVDNITNRSN